MASVFELLQQKESNRRSLGAINRQTGSNFPNLESALLSQKRSADIRKQGLEILDRAITVAPDNPDFAESLINNNPWLSGQYGKVKIKGKKDGVTFVEARNEETGVITTFGVQGLKAFKIEGLPASDIKRTITKQPPIGTDRNAVVRELFPDQDPNKLTGSQIAEVNLKVKNNRLEFERERGKAAEVEKNRNEFARTTMFTDEGVKGIDQLINTITQTPESFGVSGALAATGIGLVDQIINLGRLFAPGFTIEPKIESFLQDTRDNAIGLITDDELIDKSRKPFVEHFRKVGIENRVIQSQLVGLATTLASQEAIRGRGRLTQEAVRRQLERLGTKTNSPEAFVATLMQVRQEIIERFKSQKRIIIDQEIPTFADAPQVQEQTNVQDLGPSESQEGRIAVHPDGRKIITKNGRWVLQ